MLPFVLRSLTVFCTAALLTTACASDPPQSDNDSSRGDDDDDDDGDNDVGDDDDTSSSSDGGSGGRLDGSQSGADGGTGRSDASGGGARDSSSSSGGDASSSGGNTGGACGFVPNDTGWVAANSNAVMAQGAVFTYASMGSTIQPLTSETAPFKTSGDGRLCIKGSAAQVVDMMYAVYYGAGMGFDLCANGATDMPPNQKYTVSSCPRAKGLVGLKFKVTGATVPSELRVQFKETAREESAYVLATPGANTVLFKDAKVAYSMTAPPVDVSKIESVQFGIPTVEAAATPFDFCIEDIVLMTESGTCKDGGSGAPSGGSSPDSGTRPSPDSGTSTTPDAGGNNNPPQASNCSKGTPAWTTSGQYATRTFGKYVLRNNFWNMGAAGAGMQTLWANSERCWGVDSAHSDPGASGSVKSYPNIQRGWGIGNAGFPNASHGLNIRVSDLRKAKARWRMSAPTNGRTWALWDIYLHENNSPGAGKAPVNLMIQQRIVDETKWMQRDSAAWKKVTFGGVTYREAFNKISASYTRDQILLYVDGEDGNVMGRDDLTVDIKAIIDHYVEQGKIRATDYLTSIQAGYEIVTGGTYVTQEFWSAVQDEPDGP